jgi:hypothetical protein
MVFHTSGSEPQGIRSFFFPKIMLGMKRDNSHVASVVLGRWPKNNLRGKETDRAKGVVGDILSSRQISSAAVCSPDLCHFSNGPPDVEATIRFDTACSQK